MQFFRRGIRFRVSRKRGKGGGHGLWRFIIGGVTGEGSVSGHVSVSFLLLFVTGSESGTIRSTEVFPHRLSTLHVG